MLRHNMVFYNLKYLLPIHKNKGLFCLMFTILMTYLSIYFAFLVDASCLQRGCGLPSQSRSRSYGLLDGSYFQYYFGFDL